MKVLPTITDSRGRESHTLFWVSVGLSVLVIKFAFAGLTINGTQMPNITATEFGLSFSGIMAVWLGREWTNKTKVDK